jgi:hypothetical protein
MLGASIAGTIQQGLATAIIVCCSGTDYLRLPEHACLHAGHLSLHQPSTQLVALQLNLR